MSVSQVGIGSQIEKTPACRITRGMNSISSIGSPNIMQTASTAVGSAVAALNRDASTVAAGALTDSGQVMSALIDSKQQLLYTQAAAKLLDTASQLMGSLVDIHA
jgi:hypothetical protein